MKPDVCCRIRVRGDDDMYRSLRGEFHATVVVADNGGDVAREENRLLDMEDGRFNVIVVDHANDGTGSKDDDQEQWQSLTVN
jgi:hypothetical protein